MSHVGQTTESAERFGIDLDRLSDYLRAQRIGLDSGVVRLRKFSTGQSNPTFRLDTHRDGTFVMRAKPRGVLIKSAHMIDREFRVLRALASSDVPVPRAVHYCSDTEVAGSEFYVMQFVEGRIFDDPSLPNLDEEQRRAVYHAALDTLVRIHSVDVGALGLSDFGKDGGRGFYARQMKTLHSVSMRQAQAVPSLPHLDEYFSWASRHLPADDGATLVHGDFKLDNLVFHETEPRVVAVLDWEMATLGHPLSDLANCTMFHHLPPGLPIGHVGEDTAGIPSFLELVQRYAHGRGISVPSSRDLLFAATFALQRMAVILQGVGYRAARGQASSTKAQMFASFAATLANAAHRGATTSSMDALRSCEDAQEDRESRSRL